MEPRSTGAIQARLTRSITSQVVPFCRLIRSANRTFYPTCEDPPYFLDPKRRAVVLDTIQEVARHRQWHLYACHVRSNHIHLVVSAEAKPEKVMADFKAYCSRAKRGQSAPPLISPPYVACSWGATGPWGRHRACDPIRRRRDWAARTNRFPSECEPARRGQRGCSRAVRHSTGVEVAVSFAETNTSEKSRRLSPKYISTLYLAATISRRDDLSDFPSAALR